MPHTAISIDRVWKSFRLYQEKNQYLKTAILRGGRSRYEEFWALKDVSMDIPTGSTFGIIGSNGSGKSTLLKCLAGIITPDKGSITTNGRIAALLELGAGFHPELSGIENIYLNGAILGMTRKEVSSKVDDIVGFSGLSEFIDSPVKNYSSGMVVRLGFAIATSVEPEILIIDEVLAVGDEAFQQRCHEKIEEFREDGRTIVLVSHGLGDVARLCETVAWIDKGVVRQIGDGYEVTNDYSAASHHAQERAQGTRGNRWGSGEARVETVETLDAEGNVSDTLITGKPATIRVTYSAEREQPGAIVALSVSHLHGQLVWLSSNMRAGAADHGLSRRGVIEFKIPSFSLLKGTFDVNVALIDSAQVTHFDHWDKAHRFDVHNDDITEVGLASIRGTWHHTAVV